MKNTRALILLFCANAISGFAQGISMLAIPWYFKTLNESSLFNLIFAGVTFATLLWGLFAGTLVDRFPRKNMFLLTNLSEGVILLTVALIGWYLGGLPIYLIVFVFLVTAFGYRMHYPNLYAFVQEITPPEQYSRITSYVEIVGQATNVIAGAFAVILLEGIDISTLPVIGNVDIHIEAWSIHKIFTMDAITYFVSMVIISFIQYVPYKTHKVEKGSLKERLKSGFRFLNQNRIILQFGFFSHSIFVVFLVTLFAIMPMYITNFLHQDGKVFGGMEILYGLGALSAGFFITQLTKKSGNLKGIIMMMFLTSIVLILAATIRSTILFLIIGVIIGFSNAGTRILRVSYLFRHIPNEVIGRVNSIFSILNIIMRGCFVLLFSLTIFNQGENIIYAYILLAMFTAISGWLLWKNYNRINTFGEESL